MQNDDRKKIELFPELFQALLDAQEVLRKSQPDGAVGPARAADHERIKQSIDKVIEKAKPLAVPSSDT